MKKYFIICLILSLLVTGCNFEELPESTKALDIEKVPASMGWIYDLYFHRYTKVVAPNGKPIHIVAQNRITDEQMVRARGVLEHYLKDLPGSVYGADKSAVANRMADNGAILLMLNGFDIGFVPVPGQPLYEEEIQVEGHTWYIDQDYDNHRDATFEEILHLVHDYGIGVDGPNSFPGALPAYQSEIRAAQENALDNNLWGIGAEYWKIVELSNENSLSQEYLASVIDVYYGLWGAWDESATHGMYGLYVSKTRDEISTEDPMGAELMNNKFFHPYLTFNARIDADFQGTFSLCFDSDIPYTHHSRYLRYITLTGINNSNVRVNSFDNDITGNNGTNTVLFSGDFSDYTIIQDGSEVIVIDSQYDRDGTNTLRDVEHLQFDDQTIEL